MDRITAPVLAKYPEPRTVKTPTVPLLTFEEAAARHQACLVTDCERVAALDSVDVRLLLTPDHRVNDLRDLVGP